MRLGRIVVIAMLASATGCGRQEPAPSTVEIYAHGALAAGYDTSWSWDCRILSRRPALAVQIKPFGGLAFRVVNKRKAPKCVAQNYLLLVLGETPPSAEIAVSFCDMRDREYLENGIRLQRDMLKGRDAGRDVFLIPLEGLVSGNIRKAKRITKINVMNKSHDNRLDLVVHYLAIVGAGALADLLLFQAATVIEGGVE
jgi:hypothetical protein